MGWKTRSLHWLIGLAILVNVVLGTWGWSLSLQALAASPTPVPVDWPTVLYKMLLLFFLDSANLVPQHDNWQLMAARWIAPIAPIGAIIRVAMALVDDAWRRWKISRSEGHAVVCGLGKRGRAFALDQRQAGKRVVAIEVAPTEAHASFCALHGVLLLTGDCRDRAALHAARVQGADRLIVATGDDNGNLETAMRARTLIPDAPRRPSPFKAFVSINNPNLWREVTQSDAIERTRTNFELVPFSLSVMAARKFFWEEPVYTYADLRGQTRLHAVFLGFDDFAESLLVQMARACLYKDFDRSAATVLCPDGKRANDRLHLHYPEIDEVVDLEVHAIDVATRSLEEGDLMGRIAQLAPVTAIFVCLPSDDAALGAALGAQKAMARSGLWQAPVYVRMNACDGIKDMLRQPGATQRFPEVVKAFGMEDELCRLSLIEGTLESNAARIHAAYCSRRRNSKGFDAQRDESAEPWETLPETYREANRRAADHVKAKIASAGCWQPAGWTLWADGDVLPAQKTDMRERLCDLEHRSWAVGRRLDGWRPGPVRNNARRFHNSLVPYADLDEDTKDYDRVQIDDIEASLKDVPDAARTPDTRIRRDLWIGLIGARRIGAADRDWLRDGAAPTVLRPLFEAHHHCMLTLVSPFAPGGDQVLVEAAVALLDDLKLAYRVLIAEGVAEGDELDAFKLALAADPQLVWGIGAKAPDGQWQATRQAILAARRTVRDKADDDWVIDLTDPAAWPPDDDACAAGRRRANAYVVARSHVLVAAVRPDDKPQAGDAAEALAWRRNPSAPAARTWLDPLRPHWPMAMLNEGESATRVLDLTRQADLA